MNSFALLTIVSASIVFGWLAATLWLEGDARAIHSEGYDEGYEDGVNDATATYREDGYATTSYEPPF